MALQLSNPVFRAYALASGALLAKMIGMSWLTVYRMMRANGGFRNPEDNNPGLCNPNPSGGQDKPIEYVERSRRIHQNDIENIPVFLATGLLYVTTNPSPALAPWLFYGYVASRAVHFAVYLSAMSHEMRATFWTIGQGIIIFMLGSTVNHVRKLL